MATRTRLARKDENDIQKEVGLRLADSKMVGKPTLRPEVKRGALGDIKNIESRFLAQQNALDKDKKLGFKDIKPKVDTRWKKPTSTVVVAKEVAVKKTVAKQEFVFKQESVLKQDPIATKTIKTRSSKPELLQVQIKKEPTKSSVLEKAVGFLEHPVLQIKSLKSSSLNKTVKKEEEQNNYESHSQKLISQIDNIDENDRSNPQLLSEYVNDIYAYLYKLEEYFPIREGFLSKQTDVTPKMRSVLLDWINEVHFQFTLENETYHMAVSIIDRYLQAVSTTSRKQLQLVGVTALYFAAKFEELMPPDITDFVYVTDDTYTKAQILDMEKRIFKALGFNLAKPLPIHFLRRFAKAAGHMGDQQYILAKYFIELASIDYGMSHYKPSEIAAASLCLSLYTLNKSNDENELTSLNSLWTPTLVHYSRYTKESLLPIMKKLAQIAKGAKDVKLKAVLTKYSNSQFKFTSSLKELYGSKMDIIIQS